MIITKPRYEFVQGISEGAAKYSPGLAQHRREMQEFSRLNAVDKETAKNALFGEPFAGARAVSSIPVAVCETLIRLYPEIFFDKTGKSLMKFLATEEGRAYRL